MPRLSVSSEGRNERDPMSLAKDVVPDRAEAMLVPCLDDTVVLRATFKRQSFAPHSHPTYVLALITRGARRFRCQNKVFVAPSCSACLINPNETQTGEAATEVGWSYWSAYVPASVFGTGGARSDSKPSTPLFERRVLSDPTVNRALITFFSGVHAVRASCDAPRTSWRRTTPGHSRSRTSRARARSRDVT